MKNHERINGRLLQINKKWSHLKQRQQIWIYDVAREEYAAYVAQYGKLPRKSGKQIIFNKVHDRILEREIWIPYGEMERVVNRFIDKQNRKQENAHRAQRQEGSILKVIALNGSPRAQWNTATLLKKTLEGAVEQGAETKLFDLYGLNFKGCVSCFECKRKGGPRYGRCAMRDELTPVLEEIHQADALLMGTPVYLGNESSAFRAALERVVFPSLAYTSPPSSLSPRRIRTAVIYTMGAPEIAITAAGYNNFMEATRRLLGDFIGPCEIMACTDTLQFDDYGKYESSCFDPVAKNKRHAEVFPDDEAKATELGKRLLKPI